MIQKEFYRNLVEKKQDFSDVPGFAHGRFADFAAATVLAAGRAQRFSRNPAFELDDYFQELMVKGLEKAEYFNAVENLPGAVYATARNVAVDLWKKSRDWKGASSELVRVPMESIDGIAVYRVSVLEVDEKERRAIVSEVLEDLLSVLPCQMQTEALRSGPNPTLTIEETAVKAGTAKKTVTNHRGKLREYAWLHHGAARRQLFGPHRNTQRRESKRHSRRFLYTTQNSDSGDAQCT